MRGRYSAAIRPSLALRLEKLGQAADDAVWPGQRAGWHAGAGRIVPDRVDAEALRCGNLPLEIVAHHPGLRRRDAQRAHGMPVRALLGFAETMLAFDLDVMETAAQIEAIDLGALQARLHRW